MDELRQINSPDIKYSAFLLDDGQTFVHFAMRANEEAAKILSESAAFKEFQKQLIESQPQSLPKAENLNLVATAWEIF
jgi:hypothetical protein